MTLWTDGTLWSDGTSWVDEEELGQAVDLMAYNVAVGWDNRVDAGLLTADTAANEEDIERLQTTDIRAVWRAADTSPAIKLDFGHQIPWGGVALINSNASSSDTWQIRLSTSDPNGVAGDAYNSGVIATGIDATYSMLVHIVASEKTGRFLRVDLFQAAIPEVGRLFAGPVWLPSRAFAYGWQPLAEDPSRRSESLGQVEHIDRKFRRRGFRFHLRGVSELEYETQIEDINRTCGTSRDILVVRNLSSSNLGRDSIWGLIRKPIESPQEHPDFFDPEIEVWARV